MQNTGKIIVGTAAGLAIGTVLGVLIAPDKGTETIKKLGHEGKKIAEDLVNQGRVKIDTMKENLVEKLVDLKDDITEKVMGKTNKFGKEITE